MKVLNEFILEAPIDRAWPVLLDIPRVATCLPGATMQPGGEDGVFRGSMKIKLGPVTMGYEGTVRLEEVDEDTHTARIVASAKERKGQGTAAATITNRLEDLGGRTRVVAETDLAVTGRPAQFGRGIMEDVADRMLGEFAKRFEQELLSGGPSGMPETDRVPATAPEPVATGTASPAAHDAGTRDAADVAGPRDASSREAASAPRSAPDVLDMGSVVSGLPGARYAAAAVAATAAALVAGALLRRKRRGVRIDFSYRW
jgi:carbon monoxide dehydrogenase subunit G